jgi:single-strand DNA-binding protein
MRTTVTFEGNLADDLQVRFTPSGKRVTELTVLVNQRRQNNEGQWVEGEPTRANDSTTFSARVLNQAEGHDHGERFAGKRRKGLE